MGQSLLSHASVTVYQMLSILVSQKRSRGPGSTSSATASKSATYEVFASIRQYALLCSTARRSGIELSSIPSELYIRFPIAELKGMSSLK